MKTLPIVLVGISALAISGCAAIQGYLSPEAQTIISDVKATCNVELSYAAAIDMIPVWGPNIQAEAVAFCNLVNELPSVRMARAAHTSREIVVVFHGVRVVGHMVR